MKRVTIKDVAKSLNVSFATVSRALSDSPEISEETKERVRKACDEMGYTKNYIAQSMVRQKTDVIGLVVPSIDNPFMSELAFYIEQSARELGYTIMLCNSYPDAEQEKKTIRLFCGHQTDGIIIIPQGPKSCETLAELSRSIPTVFLSENLRDRDESYVSVDNRKGTELGVEYLYSLGHRKILYFGKRAQSTTHQLRAEGYLNACERFGLEPGIIHSEFSSSSIETGYLMAKELFRDPIDYSAVFASTDSNAIGLMHAAHESGIRIPEDLSLLGFDNIRNAALPQINLSTIEQPKEQMAQKAVAMLHRLISSSDEERSHTLIEPRLIERGSCRRV